MQKYNLINRLYDLTFFSSIGMWHIITYTIKVLYSSIKWYKFSKSSIKCYLCFLWRVDLWNKFGEVNLKISYPFPWIKMASDLIGSFFSVLDLVTWLTNVLSEDQLSHLLVCAAYSFAFLNLIALPIGRRFLTAGWAVSCALGKSPTLLQAPRLEPWLCELDLPGPHGRTVLWNYCLCSL